ncbi:hypothetical protein [Pseudozobellia thermophila]|uniref:Uncharacterized protein n=1 Tax=Pseudozobellia thermophila TaxID=192903 RepID=A0A1M6P5D0_9FLAO|nr:hypothetical protein [Pseudozobellia thermophila]SHK03177.1 hypothetical protein SAMN04488513_11818 [Pseudozobellia thermophila]
MKTVLRYILACNYSFARRWVNPKYGGDVMWTTVHGFLTPISFIAAGIFVFFIGITGIKDYSNSSWPYILGLAMVMLPIGYGLRKPTKNAIFKWGIEKEFKSLSKKQRRKRNTVAFLFFFFGFYLFMYLGIKYIAP